MIKVITLTTVVNYRGRGSFREKKTAQKNAFIKLLTNFHFGFTAGNLPFSNYHLEVTVHHQFYLSQPPFICYLVSMVVVTNTSTN